MKRRFLLGALFSQLDATLVRAAVGRLLGRVLWRANTEARRTTEINLRLCYPALTDAEREVLPRRASSRQR